VFLIDLARNLRPSLSKSAGNIWKAGTLEWLNNDLYAARSTPRVKSREPLWDQPGLKEAVDAGRYYLPGTATGLRETIVTSPIEAEPQYLLRVPGPGWTPFFAAVFTAAFFMLLTVKYVMIAFICGVLAIAMIWWWMWESDPAPVPPVKIAKTLKLPVYVSGPISHSWWAMVILLLVAGSLYLAYVFSYLYLWTVTPASWPGAGGAPLASSSMSIFAAALLLLSLAMIEAAKHALKRKWHGGIFAVLTIFALAATVGSLALDVWGHWLSGLRPHAGGYSAMVFMNNVLQAQIVTAIAVMAAFALARFAAGRLDARRIVVFDNLALFWRYSIGQSLFGLLLIHGFPRFAV
jgi:cytochrome c oxidase subunit I+III